MKYCRNSQYILDFSAWEFLTSSVPWKGLGIPLLVCTASLFYHYFNTSEISQHLYSSLEFPLSSLALEILQHVTGLVP